MGSLFGKKVAGKPHFQQNATTVGKVLLWVEAQWPLPEYIHTLTPGICECYQLSKGIETVRKGENTGDRVECSVRIEAEMRMMHHES